MKYLVENNTLTIYLEGKIDAANVRDTFKKIYGIRKENPKGNMVFDMEKLSDLSKEGIKILMALQKQEKSLTIVGASPKIYKLLDMTGLTFLINVKKALPKLSLDGCEIIGQSAKGTLYRLDEETIAKQYISGVSAETLEQEKKYAQTASGYGIPVISPYEIVQCDDRYAALYKSGTINTLSSAINADPEKMSEYTDMYSALLKRLHTTEAKAADFPSAKEIYHGKVNALEKYLVEEEFKKLQALIDGIPNKNTLVHGDFHPGNIMLQGNELVCIGIDDFSIGHPIFDFLSMYLTHVTLGAEPEQLQHTLSLSTEQLGTLWDGTLKIYFKTSADSYLNSLKHQMELYAGVKTVWCSAVGSVYTQDTIEDALTTMRQNILPDIPSITGKLLF